MGRSDRSFQSRSGLNEVDRWLCIPTVGLSSLLAMALLLAGPVALTVFSPSSGFGQSIIPREATWIPCGEVKTIATDTDKGITYIGGEFHYVGPNTGGFASVNIGTGQLSSPLFKVDGTVYACESDGAGGWYIGGEFTQVGTRARSNIAHVLPDGTVDPDWNPRANDAIRALAVSGSTVYAGGDFRTIGGQTRHHIAALDAATGDAEEWNPDANNTVHALAVSGSTVYIGGIFTRVGGQARYCIAAIDATSGAVTDWNPGPGPTVSTLVVSGTTVYVGGSFSTIGGKTRNRIAAIDSSTGKATAWDPNADDSVYSLAISGSQVIAGGRFTHIGGQKRNRMAAIDVATGAATAWNPDANEVVLALKVFGSDVYAGGGFTNIGGQARNHIAAINAETGIPTPWKPNASSIVHALGVSDSDIYVGGRFCSIGGQVRNHIAALDAATGILTEWDPSADGPVHALTLSGANLYVGGEFATIGGQARNSIAAVDTMTGNTTPWNPNAGTDALYGAQVFALAVSGPTIYAGGVFTSIGGQTRNYLAALDVATGLATSWNPNPSADGTSYTPAPHTIVVSGSTVYVAGPFTSIGGKPRRHIAALDAETGNATTWKPSVSYSVGDLTLSGSTVYIGGLFTSVNGVQRNCIAALDAVSGSLTAWNPNASYSVTELTVSGSTVYAGGAFESIGRKARSSVAALDAETGNAKSWNPGADGTVSLLAVSGSRIYVAGSFTHIGGEARPYFAEFGPATEPMPFAFDFPKGDPEGWTFATAPPLTAPTSSTLAAPPGFLRHRATDNESNFGYWESPVLPPANDAPSILTALDSPQLLLADWRVHSDENNGALVPELRLRLSTIDQQRSDALAIFSHLEGYYSPPPGGRDYLQIVGDRNGGANFRAAFDLLNFDPQNAPDSALDLDSVHFEMLDWASLDLRAETSISFAEGPNQWLPVVTTAFESPEFSFYSESGGTGALRISSKGQPNVFGYWSSVEPVLTLEAGRIYFVQFTVRSSITDSEPHRLSSFRLRCNTENLRCAAMARLSLDGADIPTIDKPVVYTVALHAAPELDRQGLLLAFDLMSFDPTADLDAILLLDRVDILSAVLPAH